LGLTVGAAAARSEAQVYDENPFVREYPVTQLLATFIEAHPDVWNEDIGEA
jgi:hypothetical protein